MTSPKSSKSTSQNPLVEEGNLKEELESLNANINVLEADLAANKERLRQAREEVKTIAATVNQTWDIVTRTQVGLGHIYSWSLSLG
jgi:chromosome segregation ATPase